MPLSLGIVNGRGLKAFDSHSSLYCFGGSSLGASPRRWEQEGVSDADIARLNTVRKADWVISHTAPYDFDIPLRKAGLWGSPTHLNEPSRKQLENVLLMYEPKKWFFGHFHLNAAGHAFGCDWTCLDMVNGGSGKCVEKIYLEWGGGGESF